MCSSTDTVTILFVWQLCSANIMYLDTCNDDKGNKVLLIVDFCPCTFFMLMEFLRLHCSYQNMCFSNSSGERVQNKNLDQGFCFEMLHYFQCLILLHQWQLAVLNCRKHSQFQVLQLAWQLPAASLNLFMFIPLATSAWSVHSWYQRAWY